MSFAILRAIKGLIAALPDDERQWLCRLYGIHPAELARIIEKRP